MSRSAGAWLVRAAVPCLAVMLGLLAMVQALAVYEYDVPSYFPRGPAHPSWQQGADEATRLLGENERLAPSVHWVEQPASTGGTCDQGYFDGPNYVKTGQGDAYWVIASAKGDPAELLRARDHIAQVWRARYGDVGGEVEDASMRLTDAQAPHAETDYHLAVGLRGDRILLQVGVPGCFGPDRRPI